MLAHMSALHVKERMFGFRELTTSVLEVALESVIDLGVLHPPVAATPRRPPSGSGKKICEQSIA